MELSKEARKKKYLATITRMAFGKRPEAHLQKKTGLLKRGPGGTSATSDPRFLGCPRKDGHEQKNLRGAVEEEKKKRGLRSERWGNAARRLFRRPGETMLRTVWREKVRRAERGGGINSFGTERPRPWGEGLWPGGSGVKKMEGGAGRRVSGESVKIRRGEHQREPGLRRKAANRAF